MSVPEARIAVLATLSATFDEACLERLERMLLSWAPPLAIVAARATLPEILTTCLLVRTSPPDGVTSHVEQAIQAFPRSPLDGLSGVAADLACALLLKRIGLSALAGSVDASRVPENPPAAWTELLEWGPAMSVLAVPGYSTQVAAELGADRDTDLARAACLAAMRGRLLACARILRWIVVGSRNASHLQVATELCQFLHAWKYGQPRLAFELRVLEAGLA